MRSTARTAVLAGALLVVAGAATAAALITGDAGARPAAGTLRLVAYSTTREAYSELISAFQGTPAGRGTSFEQSYGSSREQTRAIAAGLRADVVALSLEPDMSLLVGKGVVAKDWKATRLRGLVTRSVVVFVVRRGNPKAIRGWADLIKPDTAVVTPNVQTSGVARWNALAAYGAQRKVGRGHRRAVRYLELLYEHVVSQDKSAREALQAFLAGRGDVLLTHESEALLAQKRSQPVDYVIPKATISVESPIAVTAASANKATARAFVRFLRTRRAQLVFGEHGHRPVLPAAATRFAFPVPKLRFSVANLGGWAKVHKQFFHPQNGIVSKLQRRTGG